MGVTLGIGQFILMGYFFGRQLPGLLEMMGHFGGWGLVGGLSLGMVVWGWRIRAATRHPQQSG
ncbi:MAG: hypothetical protein P8101_06545 [Candidatus Thiodiazotropha sp.]